MIHLQTGSARRLMLLAATFLTLPSASAVGQLTGEWIVVDGRHEGRDNTLPLRVAAASRKHYVVLTQEDAAIGQYTIRRTTDGGTSWSVVRADSGGGFMVRDIAHPSNDLILAIGDTTIQQTVSHPWMIRSTDGPVLYARHESGAVMRRRPVVSIMERSARRPELTSPWCAAALRVRTSTPEVSWDSHFRFAGRRGARGSRSCRCWRS